MAEQQLDGGSANAGRVCIDEDGRERLVFMDRPPRPVRRRPPLMELP